MTESKAMITGCAGKALTVEEEAFLTREKPWGLILFARNIGTADEIRALTAHFRRLVGRETAPVFIDQEGGRVQRIRAADYPILSVGRGDRRPLSARRGSRQARRAGDVAAACGRSLPLGINVDCLPVLDVPVKGAHDVIGDRAYGNDPDTVADPRPRGGARACMAGGVLPVIKHIPGHGRAFARQPSGAAGRRCAARRTASA